MHPRHHNKPPLAVRTPAVIPETAAPKRKEVRVSLAEAVRIRRGQRSMREVAAELGEVHSSIQYVEKGRLPRPALFVKLLRWLEVITEDEASRINPYTE